VNTFIYVDADTTLYKHKNSENFNSGFDEILELKNTYSEEQGHHVSRLILGFDTHHTSVNAVNDISQYFLSLKITDSLELTGKSALEVFPLKTPWEEGFGRTHDSTVGTGATWKNSEDGVEWSTPGGDYLTKADLVSLYGIEDIPGFEFNKRTSDISVDITEYVRLWNSGVLANNGLLIKFKNETISSTGTLKFFSKDTNTIYSPYIKMSTNDFVFNPCECKSVETVTCVYGDVELSPLTPPVDGPLVSGSLVSGSLVSGSLVSGSLVSGSLVSGSLVSGSLVSGSLVSGSLVSGSLVSGSLVSGSLVSGSLVSGSLVSGSTNPTTYVVNKLTSTGSDCDGLLVYDIKKVKPTMNYLTGDDLHISLKNLPREISVKEQHRVRVIVREKYPVKKFSKKSRYSTTNFVDYPVYYSVVDSDTLERVINYDQYSRVSCDASGLYFDFDYGVLDVGRIYNFELRVESPNQTKIHADDVKFKMLR